jgi:uncharacterized membrane protein
MNMTGVSLIGWLHSVAATLAILLGGVMIVSAKGTARHRFLGRAYVYTMLATNLTAFGIYHFDIARFAPPVVGPGIFGLFHWEAVFTLAFLLLGWFAAMRQKRAVFAYLHPASMLITYYMLIGGLVNEVLVRVGVVRDFAMAHAHGIRNPAQTPLAGALQGGTMLAFIALLIVFIVQVALARGKTRRLAMQSQPA